MENYVSVPFLVFSGRLFPHLSPPPEHRGRRGGGGRGTEAERFSTCAVLWLWDSAPLHRPDGACGIFRRQAGQEVPIYHRTLPEINQAQGC